eukprot:TRINITY_DN3545_c0_g1_i4.p1 TRINITY_DN3545_c0_g1~~TRINITY_DN3545_c0_g1_i4.p1  ORF type:complete len:438 (+),score=60.62 TRINITY_DN3545_c0_g1_i4:30-1316(+)
MSSTGSNSSTSTSIPTGAARFHEYTVHQLKCLCKALKVPAPATKAGLITRIKEVQQNPQKYSMIPERVTDGVLTAQAASYPTSPPRAPTTRSGRTPVPNFPPGEANPNELDENMEGYTRTRTDHIAGAAERVEAAANNTREAALSGITPVRTTAEQRRLLALDRQRSRTPARASLQVVASSSSLDSSSSASSESSSSSSLLSSPPSDGNDTDATQGAAASPVASPGPASLAGANPTVISSPTPQPASRKRKDPEETLLLVNGGSPMTLNAACNLARRAALLHFHRTGYSLDTKAAQDILEFERHPLTRQVVFVGSLASVDAGNWSAILSRYTKKMKNMMDPKSGLPAKFDAYMDSLSDAHPDGDERRTWVQGLRVDDNLMTSSFFTRCVRTCVKSKDVVDITIGQGTVNVLGPIFRSKIGEWRTALGL